MHEVVELRLHIGKLETIMVPRDGANSFRRLIVAARLQRVAVTDRLVITNEAVKVLNIRE